jgi:ABC-type transport system substrate-binding protein
MYGFYYLSGNSSAFLESYDVFDISKVTFGPSTIHQIASAGGVVNPAQQVSTIMMNKDWPIYVTGPNQIVFRLKAPFTWFLGTLVNFIGLQFDTQYVLDNGGFGTPAAFNSYFDTNPIPGTGPYVITQVSVNSFIKYTQNPTYWGKGMSASELSHQPIFDPGHVKNVVIYYKPDDIARYSDLSTGVAQISVIQSANWNLVLANSQKYSYAVYPTWADAIDSLALNTHVYPTNITNVRLAIVHAINYTDIIQKAFFGQMTPIVGPEYSAWPQFYNLGNFKPYSYNLTLAKQYLAKANITTMPTFTFTALTGCQFCITTAEIVQADLSQIGITMNINVVTLAGFDAIYPGSYAGNLANVAQEGQMISTGAAVLTGAAVTPVDPWVAMTSNRSTFGNYAVYTNPVVERAINAFLTSENTTYIQSQVSLAQAQIYNDAPYAWIGVPRLWDFGGSLVWQKGVISGFYLDPSWNGQNDAPIFNTVTFG